MSHIWKHIQTWFKKAEESSPTNPFIHEELKRDREWLVQYEAWEHSTEINRFLGWVHEQWECFHHNFLDLHEGIDFLQTPSSNGLVLYFRRWEWPIKDPAYFLEFIKDRVSEQNYKIQVADRMVYLKDGKQETVERYYMKPRLEFDENYKAKQRYGNILIELVYKNDQAFYLKLQATRYASHEHTTGYNFSQLLTALF
ncbi:MAG: hypothetical protein KDC24_11315 [Saprospiraceae bacterium]|nr:hypothetical protein [Saprospiraceae bacterium]